MQWLKNHIKDDIIGFLLLAYIVGSILIFSAGHFIAFKLSDGEKVNGDVLWLTALAIFWYAYETYQLKICTTEQVALQEEIMVNEFLPIVEPIARGNGSTLKNNTFKELYIRNLGKGPAKYIRLYIQGIQIVEPMSLASNEEISIDVDAADKQILREILVDKPERLEMKLEYEDIYYRKFITSSIVLTANKGSHSYTLKRGRWDFENIPIKNKAR
jgi:hypothetical protein